MDFDPTLEGRCFAEGRFVTGLHFADLYATVMASMWDSTTQAMGSKFAVQAERFEPLIFPRSFTA